MYSIPAASTLVARNKASIESTINQTTPVADEAFNTVIATTQGMTHRGLYAFAADAIQDCFALDAASDALDRIGIECGCPRKPATAWQGTVSLAAVDGTDISLATEFVAVSGLQYQTQADVVAPSGASGSGVVLTLLCLTSGAGSNLLVGDTLTIMQPIAGAGVTATVTAISTVGIDDETDDDYRIRVLDAERAQTGGGGPADYRVWGEAVAGVRRVYPFTGPSWDSGIGTPTPGQRTVYVEATTSYNADGLADAALLALVRAAELADPDTGDPRVSLGFTTDNLWVESIYRTPIYVQITGLAVKTGTLAAAQTAVNAALDPFLRTFSSFIQGVDPDFERLDSLTQSLLSREIQSVLDAYGGTVQNTQFYISAGTFLGVYQISNAETLKLGGIVWA
jgi:hypothetical protein